MTDTGSIPIYGQVTQERNGQVVPMSPAAAAPHALPAGDTPEWGPTGWYEASRRALLAHHAAIALVGAAASTADLARDHFVAGHIFPTGTQTDMEQLGDVDIADMVRGLGAALVEIGGQP